MSVLSAYPHFTPKNYFCGISGFRGSGILDLAFFACRGLKAAFSTVLQRLFYRHKRNVSATFHEIKARIEKAKVSSGSRRKDLL